MIRGPFRIDPRARAAYAEGAGIYRMLPSAVARPADIADLADLVRHAAANGLALIPRGAGAVLLARYEKAGARFPYAPRARSNSLYRRIARGQSPMVSTQQISAFFDGDRR